MTNSDHSQVSSVSGHSSTADRADRADRSHLSPAVCLVEAAQLCRFLPRSLRLLLGERMALGAYIFIEAPRLVRAVAEALEEQPALFTDLPVDPARMRRHQRLALGYQTVYSALQDLADRAKDGYLRYQGAATKDAMLVVRCVRTEAQRPARNPDQETRIDLMKRAERILAGRQQRKQKSRDRREKRAAAPIAIPVKQQESPQRRAMKDVQEADLAQKARELARTLTGRRK